jgi:hypothetical protein
MTAAFHDSHPGRNRDVVSVKPGRWKIVDYP